MGTKGFLSDFIYGGATFTDRISTCTTPGLTPDQSQWTASQLGILPLELRMPQNDPQPVGDTDSIMSPEAGDYSKEGHVPRLVRMLKNFAKLTTPVISNVVPVFSVNKFSLRILSLS